ncbi:hypothetical protein PGO08_22490 [Klebsiella aerogenes]
MTDITRLINSLKRRSAHAKEFGDSITFVKLEDLDALVEALDKALAGEKQWREVVDAFCADDADWHKLTNSNNELIALLSQVLCKQADHIAVLESRTVTVKLPELCVGVVQGGHAVMVPYAAGHWFNKTAILEMLNAEGIKWEAE